VRYRYENLCENPIKADIAEHAFTVGAYCAADERIDFRVFSEYFLNTALS
jgi:hypothetical protein